MDKTITNFIRALRAADVPVSIGESVDALKTAAMIGYSDRQFLKDSLGTVVAKSVEEKEVFDQIFEIYFARDETPPPSPSGDSEDQQSSPEGGEGQPTDADSLLDMIENNDALGMQMAMENAAQQINVQQIRFSTQRGIMTRRMLEEMGLRELEQRIFDLRREGTADAEEEADALDAARAQLLAQGRSFVDRQYRAHGEAATERFMEDYLSRARLSDLDRHDMIRMRRLIRKMAKRLAAKHSRRKKANNQGKLDIRRTMRANAAYDGVPFETVWRRQRRERAKVIAICDVSGSVAAFAQFLLMLLYSLTEVIPDIRSFAFSNRLVEISDDLEALSVEEVIPKVLKDIGFGSTDYGRAFADLQEQAWDQMDRRTTVIMLGDGRSNYGDPRIDLVKELSGRIKRVVWLNPEAETLWGTGDSEMLRYRPFLHVLRRCHTVKDLELAVDDILRSYA